MRNEPPPPALALFRKTEASGMKNQEPAVPPGKIVLIVEDEFLIRSLLSDDLQTRGWVTIEASHAAEALAILEARPDIPLVFSDVRMPGKLDGIALVAVIHLRFPRIKCVLTSAFSANASCLHETFISKPYDLDEVDTVLKLELKVSDARA